MPYVKGVWVDEVLAGDPRYDILEDGGGAFKADMQINLATSVTQAGTELTAAKMNNIEDGLETVDIRSSNISLLPNGGFRIAQRGTGPFTAASTFLNSDDKYLLDGCVLLSDGNDVVDVSRVADNDFIAGYKIRLDVETANKRFGILFPIANFDIQDVRKSGKASIQFKVKLSAGSASISNVRAYLLSWNGTVDAITSDVISAWGSAGSDPTFATSWTAENTASNLAVTTTIATKTIENIAVDTSGVTNLALLIIVDDTDAVTGDFLEIGDVKVENGIVCTTYSNLIYTDELLRCQRQLYITPDGSSVYGEVDGWGSASSTTRVVLVAQFPVEMRVTPTLSSFGNFRVDDAAAAIAVTAITLDNPSKQRSVILADVASGLTQYRPYKLSADNDATARLVFSAEL
jgi:hypothetical protein